MIANLSYTSTITPIVRTWQQLSLGATRFRLAAAPARRYASMGELPPINGPVGRLADSEEDAGSIDNGPVQRSEGFRYLDLTVKDRQRTG